MASVSTARRLSRAYGMGHINHEISSYQRDRQPVVRGGISAVSRERGYPRGIAEGPADGGGRIVLSGRSRGARQDDRRVPGQGHAAGARRRGGAGLAARRLRVRRPGGGLLLRPAEGPEVRPRGGDCAVALRGLRLLLGVRRRRLHDAARPSPGGPGVRRETRQGEPADQAFAGRPHALTRTGRSIPSRSNCPSCRRVLGQFQLVPIIMGDQSYDACRALGVALAKLAAGNQHADRGQLRPFALSPLRRGGEDRPQDAEGHRRVGLLQHVAQLRARASGKPAAAGRLSPP